MESHSATPAVTQRLNSNEPCEEFVIEANTKHILIMVPGTTDPINLFENVDNDASIKYWDSPFLEGVKNFAKEFPGLVLIEHFRWSGDNQIEARQKAARDLLDLVKRVSVLELNIPGHHVNLHFICHSHGGNVIHEFTNFAKQDPEIPETLKVRSIVYLSTPFFTEQAQINTDILHPYCDIINTYNKYDLTQRFVANFSMHQMPVLLYKLENDKKLKSAIEKIVNAPYVDMALAFAAVQVKSIESLSSATWLHIHDIFTNIRVILERIQNAFDETNKEHPKFITGNILSELRNVLINITSSINLIINQLGKLQKSAADLTLGNLAKALGPGVTDLAYKLNEFFKFYEQGEFNNSGLRSPLSDLIGHILMNQIQVFDDTDYQPDPQLKGLFQVKHVDATPHDRYDGMPESKNYDAFLARLEQLEDDYRMSEQYGPEGANVRADIVFTLAAQEDYGIILLIDTLLKWMDEITDGEARNAVRKTRATIAIYARELKNRDFRILHHKPIAKTDVSRFVPFEKVIEFGMDSLKYTIERFSSMPFMSAEGGIPYLAVESHSVSRRTFLSEVKTRWRSAMPDDAYIPMYILKKKSCAVQ